MDSRNTLINWSLLMALVFLWGTSFMFISISVETLDPYSIVFYRLVLGSLVLVIVCYARGQRLPVSVKAWLAFFLMGFVGNLFPFFLIAWGQQSVNSGVAGMIMAIVFEGGGRAAVGGFAIFIAATSYAVNTILVRRLPRYSPLVAGTGVLVAASITMLPLWLWLAPADSAGISLRSMNSVIWLGIGPTGIATIILFAVIERAGPTFLSTINYMIPVVAFFAGALILSEPVEWHSIVALVTILGGIALTRFRVNQVQPGN